MQEYFPKINTPLRIGYCFYFIFLVFWGCSDHLEDERFLVPEKTGKYADQYVGASVCAQCHAEAHQKWQNSSFPRHGIANRGNSTGGF